MTVVVKAGIVIAYGYQIWLDGGMKSIESIAFPADVFRFQSLHLSDVSLASS